MYNPDQKTLTDIMANVAPYINYFEAKFIQMTNQQFLEAAPNFVPSPYFTGGIRNYLYIVIVNDVSFSSYPTNSYNDYLKILSDNPGGVYGCYVTNAGSSFTPTNQITSAYDAG
jgi:hypothetical protein